MDTLKKTLPHLHPIFVHFPQALFPVAFASFVLGMLTGNRIFESGALTAVIFGLLSSPVCIITGHIDWRLRYSGAMTRVFRIKIWGAYILAFLAAAALAVRLLHPEIAGMGISVPVILYASLLGACTVTCVVLGYYGGKLVFH
jgi:uncharacterized membrane protein